MGWKGSSKATYNISVQVQDIEAAEETAKKLLAGDCKLYHLGSDYRVENGDVFLYRKESCEMRRSAAKEAADALLKTGKPSTLKIIPSSDDRILSETEKRLSDLRSEYDNNRGYFNKLPIAESIVKQELEQLGDLKKDISAGRDRGVVMLNLSLLQKLPPGSQPEDALKIMRGQAEKGR